MAKDKMSYQEALTEIEGILASIEEGSLGVDELAEKVDRVTFLLKICRDKLHRTEDQINKILNEDEESAEDGS